MRIHVVGGSGSGKTSLGRLISKGFGVPHCDLDDLFWDRASNIYGIKADPAVRDAELSALVATPRWVIEGIYLDEWVSPVDLQERRIWARYDQQTRGLAPAKGGVTRESVLALIDYNRRYTAALLPEFLACSRFQEKMLAVRDGHDVLESLAQRRPD